MAICFSNTVFSQKINQESYKIYSALIKSKIRDSSKANVVLKKLVTDTLDFFELRTIINLIQYEKEEPHLSQYSILPNLEYSNQKIDSLTKQQILNFYSIAYEGGTLENLFDINSKIILVKKFPDARYGKNFYHHLIRRWHKFYEKYSQARFFFRFSKVYFSEDNKIAIFMYAYGGKRFMGGTALTIMESKEDKWSIKYELDLRDQAD
jgi:hypothetical protein